MVICPNCGNRIGVPRNLCPVCGVKLTVIAKPSRPAQPQYVKKTCGRCNGTGREILGGTCRGCGGAGSVAVLDPATRCGHCNGYGCSQISTSQPCSVCHSTGWLNARKLI